MQVPTLGTANLQLFLSQTPRITSQQKSNPHPQARNSLEQQRQSLTHFAKSRSTDLHTRAYIHTPHLSLKASKSGIHHQRQSHSSNVDPIATALHRLLSPLSIASINSLIPHCSTRARHASPFRLVPSLCTSTADDLSRYLCYAMPSYPAILVSITKYARFLEQASLSPTLPYSSHGQRSTRSVHCSFLTSWQRQLLVGGGFPPIGMIYGRAIPRDSLEIEPEIENVTVRPGT